MEKKSPVKFDLKKYSTRQLLDWLYQARKLGGCVDLEDCGMRRPEMTIYYDDLKEELKTRPHIPSKHEGKMLRRLASQGKLNRR